MQERPLYVGSLMLDDNKKSKSKEESKIEAERPENKDEGPVQRKGGKKGKKQKWDFKNDSD